MLAAAGVVVTGITTAMGSATGTSFSDTTSSPWGNDPTGVPSDELAAAGAARLKKGLRWCNLLSLGVMLPAGGAALPAPARTTTSAKIKQAVHTTTVVTFDLRPVCNGVVAFFDAVSMALPPLVTGFESPHWPKRLLAVPHMQSADQTFRFMDSAEILAIVTLIGIILWH